MKSETEIRNRIDMLILDFIDTKDSAGMSMKLTREVIRNLLWVLEVNK